MSSLGSASRYGQQRQHFLAPAGSARGPLSPAERVGGADREFRVDPALDFRALAEDVAALGIEQRDVTIANHVLGQPPPRIVPRRDLELQAPLPASAAGRHDPGGHDRHHAGRYTRATVVDEAVTAGVADLTELAPLHQSRATAALDHRGRTSGPLAPECSLRARGKARSL